MLSRLCRIARRSSASPFEPPADRFNPLALSMRLAFAGALTTGFGTSAYAQAQTGTTQEVSKDTKELPAVTVNAESGGDLPETYAGGQLARDGRVGLLGNKSVMDTPFSVSDYTSKRMEDQQAVTLAEVLNKDPSTRFTGQIGGVTDSFFIRGFPVNEGNLSEVAFDGVYGVSPNYHLFTEYLERVEVLKGPAALLYGMSPNSGVGGVINVMPKRPLNKDLTRVTLDYASDSKVGEAIDLSRRFGSERQFGIRFNGLHRQGGTPLDNQKSRAEVGALSLDYQGERFRASLDVIEQYQWVDAPTRPFLVASGIQVPSAPDGRRNVTQSWGWWKSNDTSTLLHAEYDVNDHVTVFGDAGGTKSDVSRLSDQTPTILNSAGDTAATPQNWKFQINRSTADTGVRTQFSTGAVKHAVVLQANVYQDRIASASNSGKAILSNIYSSIASPEQNVSAPTSVPKLSASTLSGVALADTMSMLNERLQLTLGVRQQHVQSDNFSATTGARTSSYNESATTPLVGLVVKPWQNVSFYANYIEGLSKGDIAPTTASNAGQVFAPYKTKQEEVGVKLDMSGVLATLAAFRITKPSGQLYGTVYSVDSEQRNQGLELNVSGEPLKGVRLLGGVTLLDATLTKTNSAATVGNRPVGVPTWMANVGTEWDLPWVPGFTLTGGVNYTGREYVNQANTQSVPSWTTVDLGARYQTRLYGKSTTVRAGLLNAFDRKYWSGVASYGTISLGAPRTIFLSASVDF
ncbi:iron complex outermembrane receptor protein [Paraburkholderia sp. BL23I1N1]|uniref:TonB-dependent receptor n=1 Tax=Paraburkholderia sp. BL23I1N1 TaxID=1938802 RepID=UPI000E73C9F8|nr:TonB-dependent siderophore receptor [Paraburkholderia sp. BL23I1N1]RKE37557.1 iron complex outermembrane receptor protein [Paraburkholderia sp. BL23I1N1]